MWRAILEKMRDFPSRLKVVKLFIELGLAIGHDGKVRVGPVEITDQAIARALGVDRRVVRKTIEQVMSDEGLRRIFSGLKPAGAFLAPIAKYMGYHVIEIRADPRAVGVLAEAAKVVAEEGIAIRQAVAEDPDLFPEPKLVLVLEKQPSGDTVGKMLKIQTVQSVTSY